MRAFAFLAPLLDRYAPFARINGADPRAFIVSCNVERRSLTAGQKAMAVALIYPHEGKGGRGKKENLAESAGFSGRTLRDARIVVRCFSNLDAHFYIFFLA